jgi:hypothetical protein
MRGAFRVGDRAAMGIFLLVSGVTVVGLGLTSAARTKAKQSGDFDALLSNAGLENKKER